CGRCATVRPDRGVRVDHPGELLGAPDWPRHGPLPRRRSRLPAGIVSRRKPALPVAHAGLPVAGRQRGPVRLRQLSVRALALGVDGRAALTGHHPPWNAALASAAQALTSGMISASSPLTTTAPG